MARTTVDLDLGVHVPRQDQVLHAKGLQLQADPARPLADLRPERRGQRLPVLQELVQDPGPDRLPGRELHGQVQPGLPAKPRA